MAVTAVPATIALIGTLALATVQVVNAPPSHDPSCIVLIDKVADLAEEHPEVAERYASGRADLSKIASPEEIEACGDPTALFEDLAPSPQSP